ncbi:putative DNA glycosylase At3g47830 isoform X4 [Herrania umbratica]|uniref:DNA glycosylase At3g47830 isoform X4 n=1 Tax=Herrania umbratica TaxID=108875 RepID=A0A6J1AXS0_9ROSI|nr:putative DNA glycosylase At3g47830 isoform X4 [Herrania umbratica]
MKMQKSRKRKQLGVDGHSKTPKITTEEPYPSYHRPTPDECRSVRDELLALHGFPAEFLKYRRQRLIKTEPTIEAKSEPLDNNYDDGEESVLDGLVKTVLSQNTAELNSQKAFASLKSAFPTWEDVLAAESKNLENAIRCGGLAPRKASCIKNVLRCLHERKGKLCFEYLRDLSIDEIKAELSNFKGVGPKTQANKYNVFVCVTNHLHLALRTNLIYSCTCVYLSQIYTKYGGLCFDVQSSAR